MKLFSETRQDTQGAEKTNEATKIELKILGPTRHISKDPNTPVSPNQVYLTKKKSKGLQHIR